MALSGSTIASTFLKLLRMNSDTMGADATASYLQDSADTDSALSISTTRVGIGTAVPSAVLTIAGTSISNDHTGADVIRIIGNSGTDEYRLGIGWADTAARTESAVQIGYVGASASSEGHGGFYISTRGTTSGEPTERVRVDEDGNVGIGTTSPDGLLEISNDDSNPVYISSYHNTGTISPGIYFRKADNTEAAPHIVTDDEVLGSVVFQGMDASSSGSFITGAIIQATVNDIGGDLGADSMPTDLEFYVNTGASTAAIRAMTIRENGFVGIGESAPTFALQVAGGGTGGFVALFDNNTAAETSHGIVIRAGDTDHADTATHYILFEESDGDDVGELDSDGGALALSDTSDYRLKENINSITGGLAKVNALKPSTFNYKRYPNKVHEGFIAHEVTDAGIGYAVRGDKDAVKDDGSVKPQLFAISNLIPQMVSAIQELSAKVTALENA